jgi:hypothetical protein
MEITSTTGRYSDAAIGSNISAAWEFLERATGRWFGNRASVTWTTTSQGATSVPIPGFRTVTSATQQGTTLVADSTYYLVPDSQQSGVFTAVQLRGFGSRSDGPWYLSNPEWFDRNLDSYHYGSGWRYSVPNDLVLAGAGGYVDTDVPFAARHAAKVLAGWYTLRPNSLLANVSVTPEGANIDNSSLPTEVRQFLAEWSLAGIQAVSVG